MRRTARLVALASLISACSPAAVSGLFDAATDRPAAADAPIAPGDVPVTPADVPTVVDAGSPVDVPMTPPVDAGVIPPPIDAGSVPRDSGGLGDPVWVPLEVRVDGVSCPPLAPCGGNEVGTWDVGGGCIDFATPTQLMSCPGARFTRTTGRARGRVTFAGGFAQRASQWEVEGDFFVPQLCAAFVGGCAALQSLVSASFPGATCTTVAAGCTCTARQTGSIDDADRYSIASNQIVSVSSGKRWNYCVAGTQLRYTDVSASGPREAGIIQLTRRAP